MEKSTQTQSQDSTKPLNQTVSTPINQPLSQDPSQPLNQPQNQEPTQPQTPSSETKKTQTSEADLELNLMREELKEFPYKLPDFDNLAEEFDIEKAFDKETSFLLREIRKLIVEKLSAYLQLFETFMNPTSPPMFIFSAIRNFDEKDREKVKELYKEFSKYQLWAIRLDTIYNEEKEAEFISETYNQWQKYKKEIYEIIEKLEISTTEKSDEIKTGYFN